MQKRIKHFRKTDIPDAPTRIASSFLALIGAVALSAMLIRSVSLRAMSWSPTETARSCFYYPGEHVLPDRDEISQMLLSALFFGTDALYFDSGDENTGVERLPSKNDIRPHKEDTDIQPQPNEPTPDHTDDPITEEPEPPEETFDIYSFDPSIVPEDELALIPYDLTRGASPGEVLLSNTTAYDIDPSDYTAANYPISANLSDEPLVLIIHTHATEAYSPSGAVSVPQTSLFRSSDTDENMIAVGAVMADIFNSSGIPTVHVSTMHDLESYQRSYDLAADTIQQYIRKYPSIKYVFDVHRDAIYNSDGDLIKPVTVINGEPCAQVMIVVGTNEKGADHPNWETNFTVAAHWQSTMTATYERFARPVNIRGASFNEQFTPGSLLLEIGSAANSLEESKNAAKYMAYSFVDMINGNSIQ